MNTPIPFFCIFLLICVGFGHAAERAIPNAAPQGWMPSVLHKRSTLAGQEIQITVALSQRNVKQLESEFWTVSDPKNSNYGQYKSFQEVVELVAPSQTSIEQVMSYFHGKGISATLHDSRDFLSLYMRVAQAEAVFQTELEPYVHSTTGQMAVRMRTSYTLDDEINSKIDFVSHFFTLSGLLDVKPDIRVMQQEQDLPSAKLENNAPFLLFPWVSNAYLTLEAILFCPDGSAPTISKNAAIQNTLICGSVNVTGMSITFVSQITNNILFNGRSNLSLSELVPCSEKANCLLVAQQNKLPLNATYVSFILNVLNRELYYVPYKVNVYLTYSDNSTSAVGMSTTVEVSDLSALYFLRSLYAMPFSSPKVTQQNNSQAVVQYFGHSFNPADLPLWFMDNSLPDYSNLITIVNPRNFNVSNAGPDASLTLQSLMGMAPNCPTTFWASNSNSSDLFLSWIIDVLNRPTSPLVFAISQGGSERDGYTPDYFNRINIEFMKAGVRGITIIYSAGDNGPFSLTSTFDPVFPATSPYVTTVGGTQFYSMASPSCFDGDEYICRSPDEVVCSIANGAGITGGGGFSNVYARPSYQDGAILGYLPRISSLAGVNFSGRAYPDVAVAAHNVPYFLDSQKLATDSTAAPVSFFAGIVTLMNDIRLSVEKPPLGFLNPFIYALGNEAFKDIVRGNNNCTKFNCYPVGYPAAQGWDAASGRGSPVFSTWATAVLNLPSTTTTSSLTSTTSSLTSTTTTTTNTTARTTGTTRTTATASTTRIATTGTTRFATSTTSGATIFGPSSTFSATSAPSTTSGTRQIDATSVLGIVAALCAICM